MKEKFFNAAPSKRDRVSFGLYVILPLFVFGFLGLAFSIATGSVITAAIFLIFLFILAVWLSSRMMNKDSITMYKFGENGLVVSPLNFFLSMHLKDGTIPYSIITRIDILKYGPGYRKDSLTMRLDLRYSIIGTSDSWIPERAIVVHTDREMSPKKTMSFSFTPEDIEGFISELKSRLKRKIKIGELEV